MNPSHLLIVTALSLPGAVQTGSTPASQDAEPLTDLRLEVGAAFHLTGTERLVADFNMLYGSFRFEIDVEQELDIVVVEELTSGDYLLNVTLGRAKGKVKTPLGEEAFDSDAPPEAWTGYSNFYLHLIEPAGKTYQAVLSRNGVVVEARGFCALFDGTECRKIMDTLGMPCEEEVGKVMLQWVLPPVPGPSTNPEVKWQVTYPLRLLGEMIVFTPRCVVETSTAVAVSWKFATEVEGRPLTDEEIEGADPEAPLYEWYSRMAKFSTANLSGRVRFSKEDGMLIEHDTRVGLSIGVFEQQHGIPAVIELVWKRETRRREPEEASGDGDE